MSNELVVNQGNQVKALLPTTIDEAYRMGKAFALAGMLPKSYGSGNPEEMAAKAFTAMQLGAEVGMSPMQSIQSIAVVNGMPSIWGDAQKALVINHHSCEYIKESYEDEPYQDNFKAVCIVKRRGQDEVREEFSVADAKAAGLWKKSGPWTTHPKRMLRYKARSFVLRDNFPDVLKGLTHSVEEMQDIKDVTPQNNTSLKAAFLNKATPDNTPNQLDDLLSQGSEVVEDSATPTLKTHFGAPIVNDPQRYNLAEKKAEEILTNIEKCENATMLQATVALNEMHMLAIPEKWQTKILAAIAEKKKNLEAE